MKIALFGGAFDPPHRGHHRVSQELLTRGWVDQVWYVPVYKHPWEARLGKFQMTAYPHRRQLVKLVAATHPQTYLREYRQVSFTYPTLVHFTKRYPDHQFWWVMGSEYLPKFDDFLKGHPKLLDFPFFVYPRAGHPLQPLYDQMMPLTDAEQVVISSTQVRGEVKAGQPIDQLVIPPVAEYIRQHQLYL